MQYTPDLIPGINVANVSVSGSQPKYFEKDGVVTVSGVVHIEPIHKKDATHTGLVTFYMSLPVADGYEVTGLGSSINGENVDILENAIDGIPVAEFQVICHNQIDTRYYFTFSYCI